MILADEIILGAADIEDAWLIELLNDSSPRCRGTTGTGVFIQRLQVERGMKPVTTDAVRPPGDA
jgi:hypothetical protein